MVRPLSILLALLSLPSPAQGGCRPYEAHAFEGRLLAVRQVEAADIPASPRVDAASVASSLARSPLVLLEIAIERRRRVAWCESLGDCTPAPRAWVAFENESLFLAGGQVADWSDRVGRRQSVFAPRSCCDVIPAKGPACGLSLRQIVDPPDDLREFVFDGDVLDEAPPLAHQEQPPEARREEPPLVPEVEPRYERARALYAEGPEHAADVIDLLRLHLAETPQHEEARRLLAITLFGSLRFEEALVEFDTLLAAAEKRDRLLPRFLLLKARALEALGRGDEARAILVGYRVFYDEESGLKREADELAARLAARGSRATSSDLFFLQVAVRAIAPDDGRALMGALAILVRSPEFDRLGADSDLGPVIASARAHGDDVIVLIYRGPTPHVAFFRGARPSACTTGGEPRRDCPPPQSDARDLGLQFEPGTLTADDGTPLLAYELRRDDSLPSEATE